MWSSLQRQAALATDSQWLHLSDKLTGVGQENTDQVVKRKYYCLVTEFSYPQKALKNTQIILWVLTLL